MSTKYRIDRVLSRQVPAGMNSIRGLYASFSAAKTRFNEVAPGLDTWDQPNPAYGVILSVWDGERYMVKCEKGL